MVPKSRTEEWRDKIALLRSYGYMGLTNEEKMKYRKKKVAYKHLESNEKTRIELNEKREKIK